MDQNSSVSRCISRAQRGKLGKAVERWMEGKYFNRHTLSYLAKGSGEYARHCRQRSFRP